ncbi:hypothetical protein [Streptomyces gardneri]|uniref:Lipoprotein n=1 Tax=Streptomyces gardneri TaxID=66892 RepID=A0A4Y3RFQ5_9ACTN|nr:hypothetical protein [Streptomyces gardneri]GEB56512.1 hypothetical protein SGA01_21170 [Streptomyces gardneri]GHH13699.1 hypothetical protein GCM10017674_61260 [Streptomyces gardneri]
MKRIGLALAGGAAVTVAVAAVTVGTADAGRSAGDDGRAGASVTRIEFTEAVPLETDPSVTTNRRVEMFAEHRGDAVSRLRFVITFEGRTAEERLWRADRPESITSRNWESCTTGDEPTPAPKPDGLDVILRGYFGPREIPRDAKKVAGGANRWETPMGMMRMTYTDLGGPYPHRIVEIKGPDGSIGSTISGTRTSEHPAFPDWRPDWRSCRPSAAAG